MVLNKLENYVNKFIIKHKKFQSRFNNYLNDNDDIKEYYNEQYSNENILSELRKFIKIKVIKNIAEELETQTKVVQEIVSKHWSFNIYNDNNENKNNDLNDYELEDDEDDDVYVYRAESLPLKYLFIFGFFLIICIQYVFIMYIICIYIQI